MKQNIYTSKTSNYNDRLISYGTFKTQIKYRANSSDGAIIDQIFLEKQLAFNELPEFDIVKSKYKSIIDAGRTPLIVDCGANIGISLIWFAMMFPEATIIGVEPDLENCNLAMLNIEPFPNITLVNKAINDTNEKMFVNDYGRGAAGLVAETQRITKASKEIPTITINELLSSYKESELFLVKIDIEGGESKLFESNIEWLFELSILVIELHDWIYLGEGVSSNFWGAAERLDGTFHMLGEHVVFFRNNDSNRDIEGYDREFMTSQKNSFLRLISMMLKTYGSFSKGLAMENIAQHEKMASIKHEQTASIFRENIAQYEKMVYSLRKELTEAKLKTDNIQEQINSIQSSISWRITKPIRIFRNRYPKLSRSLRRSLKTISGMFPRNAYRNIEGDKKRDNVLHEAETIFKNIKKNMETVVVVSHDATRTGAPLLSLNIVKELTKRYNTIVILLGVGPLLEEFKKSGTACLGPYNFSGGDSASIQFANSHINEILRTIQIKYAIINSIESRYLLEPLVKMGIPTISLIHEFAANTWPKDAFINVAMLSEEIVFSAEIVKDDVLSKNPSLKERMMHVLPQGQVQIPITLGETERKIEMDQIRRHMVRQSNDTVVVLGCGTLTARKGVDLFVNCASKLNKRKKDLEFKFVWIGHCFDFDILYKQYILEQIERSGLQDKVILIDEVSDLSEAYRNADIFFLSSRLDPLPNVAIDAMMLGLPVVCFDQATGIADILKKSELAKKCVIPYLDDSTAANVIEEIVSDKTLRKNLSESIRDIAICTFNMKNYVQQIENIAKNAELAIKRRQLEFEIICKDEDFDHTFYLMPSVLASSRIDAINYFLANWSSWKMTHPYGRRKPFAGFNAEIYAANNLEKGSRINPLAHFIESGKPNGPWTTRVIRPSDSTRAEHKLNLTVLLHIHIYYLDLAEDIFRRLRKNITGCDLVISTDSSDKADCIRSIFRKYEKGTLDIRVVPNIGRDLAPILLEFAPDIKKYDIVGHIHTKKSLHVTERVVVDMWREFLLENMLGGLHCMMDTVLAEFERNDSLGIVFPDDPNHLNWCDPKNKIIAQELIGRMGISLNLPEYFNFPVGTMFWARTESLLPILNLDISWDEFLPEPLPIDGTLLHAIERLIPLIAESQGYQVAVTRVPNIIR